MALNHPVGGLSLPELSGVGKGQTFGEGEEKNEESPHLAGRCLALFRLQSLSQPKRRKGARGGGASQDPLGKRERLINTDKRPQIRQKGTKGGR